MRVRQPFVAMLMFTLLGAGTATAGQVSHHSFHSETLGRDYPYTLYLPDGYAVSNQSYPVVYLLHGSFGSDRDWVKRGRLKQIADRLIGKGRIPPAVIVMPRSRSWWVDGHNEQARTAFFEDLIPHIENNWHVVPEREWRTIGGLSAGGFGAINFILERPDLFVAAAALSPAAYAPLPPRSSSAWRHPAFQAPEGRFDTELWQRVNYTAHLDSYKAQERVVPLYLSAGSRDVHDAAEYADFLYRILEQHQPGQVSLEVLRGGHSWRVWRASLPSVLEFLFQYAQGPRALEPDHDK
ncbi:hypothetical protein L861_16980 [Litchfieldella anticariensis FP35 = DSM 16096]|uniref:Esterase n=1 Tax=Litchfieldella anticariensis (strain DSM 16096 / CECT 5854 / CIP 108499 / LMG 22089 / FP35) TaxID=1121939 RepID=S2LA28_LITA3|nr:alpha/beta hydrolase-fold protein [Halomonas anticariensis]EPC01566.1 hypothetical protein L861_16980 [Halomonas anticariensis FP35 = DSM 16096]